MFRWRLKEKDKLVRKRWGWHEIKPHFRQMNSLCGDSAAAERLGLDQEHKGKCRASELHMMSAFDLNLKAMGSH